MLSKGRGANGLLTSSILCPCMRVLSLRCTWFEDFFSASLACSSASLAAAAAPAAVFFFSPICRKQHKSSKPDLPHSSCPI